MVRSQKHLWTCGRCRGFPFGVQYGTIATVCQGLYHQGGENTSSLRRARRGAAPVAIECLALAANRRSVWLKVRRTWTLHRMSQTKTQREKKRQLGQFLTPLS